MDWSVPGLTKSPIFVKTSLGERLTVIAVDVNVKAVNGKLYDVLFLGTTNGRVLKVINIEEDQEKGRTPKSRNPQRSSLYGDATSQFHLNRDRKITHPVLIESLQVLPYDMPVRNLMVINRKDADILQEDKLIVISDHDVKSIPLQRCKSRSLSKSCGDCVALQDPYCAWDQVKEECVEHSTISRLVDISNPFSNDNGNLIQQLETGFHTACPPDVYSIDPGMKCFFYK
jgi:semaphorin 6